MPKKTPLLDKKAINGHITEFTWNTFVVFVKVICTSAIILLLVFLMFSVTSGNASVVVEINEIPINWRVDLLCEQADENDMPRTAIRANICNEVAVLPGQDCMIFGSEAFDYEDDLAFSIDYSGYFIVDGCFYENASLNVKCDHSYLLDSDDTSFYLANYQPVITIKAIDDEFASSQFELRAGLSGESVLQTIIADFNSYYFRLFSSPDYYSDLLKADVVSGDIELRSPKGFYLCFEDCNAYLIDEEGIEHIITECEYYFDSGKDVMIIGMNKVATEQCSYSFQLRRTNDFSIAASKFQDMYLYGVGELSISNTAKEDIYPLKDQEVALHFDPSENIRDNIYTFEHKYVESTDDEESIFRLNAKVKGATISGESVIPNFWSWFREVVYNDPLSIVIVILGQIALFGFIGKRKDSEKIG